MEEKLVALEAKIKVALEPQKIIVDQVAYVREGKYNFLRITLDKLEGIDLDTIVAATEVINPLVDQCDITDDNYILDVISKERNINNG